MGFSTKIFMRRREGGGRVISCEEVINPLAVQGANGFPVLPRRLASDLPYLEGVNCHRSGNLFLFMCHGLCGCFSGNK